MAKTVLDALRYDGHVRIICGDRSLVWDDSEFVVYERKRGRYNTTTVIRTESENDAITALLEPPTL